MLVINYKMLAINYKMLQLFLLPLSLHNYVHLWSGSLKKEGGCTFKYWSDESVAMATLPVALHAGYYW